MSKKSFGFVGAVFAVLFAAPIAIGYAQALAAQPDIPVDEIIRKFSEKEKEFKLARMNYGFQQEIKVQELSDSDRVQGEYQIKIDVSFDDKGRRVERVVYAPPSGLKSLILTAEDEKRFRDTQAFVMTSDEVEKYNFKYVGKEKLDEVTCYVFDVSPKKAEKGQLYFEGKIWVDDLDLQIVKTYGKLPDIITKDNENLFPKFETYREKIDGFWFPTYVRAVDTLEFAGGHQKTREIVKFTNYKRFQTSVKLRFGDVVDDNGKPIEDKPEDNKAPALDPKYKTDPKQDPKKK